MAISMRKSRVLIVDDEASNIAILERLFRSEYQTVTATNGQNAIELLAGQSFEYHANPWRIRAIHPGPVDVEARVVDHWHWQTFFSY